MGREQFTFYRSFWEALKALPKKDQLPFVMAICSYALDGESKTLTGASLASFLLVKPVLNKANARSESGKQSASKLRANVKQTLSKREANDEQTLSHIEKEGEGEEEREKEKDKEKEIPTVSQKRNRFCPPSVEEVAAYCMERGNGVDPQKFVDFYVSKGWMIGKSPMKDWRAAVRTWEQGRSMDDEQKTVISGGNSNGDSDTADVSRLKGIYL